MGVYLEQIIRVTWDKYFEDQVTTSCQGAALAIARPTRRPVTSYQRVAGVLDRTPAVRLRMGVPQTTLTTLDKAIAEGLVALGFSDMEAAACLLLLPQGESILEELRKLLKNPGVEL